MRGYETLRALAADYRHAAGEAFAQGNTILAEDLRDAADKLTALAEELPDLPAGG